MPSVDTQSAHERAASAVMSLCSSPFPDRPCEKAAATNRQARRASAECPEGLDGSMTAVPSVAWSDCLVGAAQLLAGRPRQPGAYPSSELGHGERLRQVVRRALGE